MINESRVIFLVVTVLSIGWAVTTNCPPQELSPEAVVRCGASADLVNGDTLGRQALVGSLRWAPLPTILIIPLLIIPTLMQTGFAACVVAGLTAGVFAAFLNGWLRYCQVDKPFRYLALALIANPLSIWQGHVTAGRSSVMFAMLVVSSCCMLIHWLQTLKLRSLAYLSILCGLVVLTRYQAILFVGLVFAVVLAYLLVEREKETYAEGTLIILLSPTVYAAGLWFAANWLIMGDPFFFLRGLRAGVTAAAQGGLGWRDLLTEQCEWSFCMLPLFLALLAWTFTQYKPFPVLRLVRGVAIVALAGLAMFVEVKKRPPLLSGEEVAANVELDQVVSEIEKTYKDRKVAVSGHLGYQIRRRIHTYGIFRHYLSIYLDKVLEETRGQQLHFLVRADSGEGRWEDMSLTYPGIYENGAPFAIFESRGIEHEWQNWRLFRVVRIDHPRRLGRPTGVVVAGAGNALAK